MIARRRPRSPAKPAKSASKGLLIGYARVSKGDDQSNILQARALRAVGCRRIFEEAASGGRWDRPELHRMLDQVREGDTVVVWKLDRLSRSLKDVLYIMERIGKAGAGFRSITEAIDTTTATGRMMMQMVGAFAEFERAMIRERTSAGPGRGARRGPNRRPSQEARSCKAPRNRGKRYLRPQDRRRNGTTLQYQRADRLTHRRRAPRRSALAYVCGRRPLGKDFFGALTMVGSQSCVRPFDRGHIAAGPDGVREPGPIQFCALEVRHANRVVPAPVSTVCHHAIVALTNSIKLFASSGCPLFDQATAVCGRRKLSPPLRTAQTIRASLFAMAVITTRVGRRASRALIHTAFSGLRRA